MPGRRWKLRVEDILEAIDEIGQFTKDLTYEAFCAKKRTIKAVLYNIAVIGEAARNVPTEVRAGYPNVPWREMADIRNVVIHEYFGVDLDILWETV
jgi:uncharacterized protein with HEPN domain